MRRALPPVLAALALAVSATPASATIIQGAVDKIAAGPQTIAFASFAYTPKLLAVSPGTVTWSGATGSHPLRFEDGGAATVTPTEDTRTLPPGVFRYYCGIHGAPGGLGMSGVVYVAGPAAALTASPAAPQAAGPVTLDASGTDFLDVTPNTSATYAFDTDGDGTFDTSGGAPSVVASFPLGTRTAKVRVTDDDGRTGEASVTVRVGPAAPSPGTGAGGTTGGPAAGGTPAGTPGDAAAPVLGPAPRPRPRLAALRAATLRLSVGTLSEAAHVRGALLLDGRVIARAADRSASAGPLRLTLRTTAAGRRTLRARRSATVVLRLELTDAAGNRRIVRRTLRLAP